MSSISTCEASSLDLRVAEMDSAVTPEAFASAAAWVSVGAAMERRGWVVEKGREFRVIVDEVGLDILKAARKIEARASIGRAGRRARRYTKDVGHVFCELKELEIRAARLTLRHWPLWRVSESLFTAWGWSPNTDENGVATLFSEYNAGAHHSMLFTGLEGSANVLSNSVPDMRNSCYSTIHARSYTFLPSPR